MTHKEYTFFNNLNISLVNNIYIKPIFTSTKLFIKTIHEALLVLCRKCCLNFLIILKAISNSIGQLIA